MWLSKSTKEFLEELVPGYFCMGSHIGEDCGKGPELDATMTGNGDVVLSALSRSEALVTSGLAADGVAEAGEGVNQFVCG